MYIIFGILVFVCIVFFIIFHWKKRKIICKLCNMQLQEKICLLNQVMEPFGFCYSPSQDIITSRIDAWQRQFGYRSLYDKTAVHFSMVFDCEPVYFDYNNRTWMFECWKGQYGISAGSEVGIYCADRVLSPWEYDKTLFQSVSDSELLTLSVTTFYKGNALFTASQPHWWLTGFCPGKHCSPEDLVIRVSITFRCEAMMCCFLQSLMQSGYIKCGISVCDMTVTFVMAKPFACQPCCKRCFNTKWVQFKNRFFCKLYMLVTKPFACTLDKILYLYCFLPFVFRHMLCMRKNKKQKYRKCYREYKKSHKKIKIQ